jgi:hypothetical protein
MGILVVNVYVEVNACGWRRVMSVVPPACMMMIAMVIMAFIAAGKRSRHYAD